MRGALLVSVAALLLVLLWLHRVRVAALLAGVPLLAWLVPLLGAAVLVGRASRAPSRTEVPTNPPPRPEDHAYDLPADTIADPDAALVPAALDDFGLLRHLEQRAARRRAPSE